MIEHIAHERKQVTVAWRRGYQLQLETRMRWWSAAEIVWLFLANGSLIVILVGYTLHLPFLPSSAAPLGKTFIFAGLAAFGCIAVAICLTAFGKTLRKRRLLRLDAPPVRVNERNCACCLIAVLNTAAAPADS